MRFYLFKVILCFVLFSSQVTADQQFSFNIYVIDNGLVFSANSNVTAAIGELSGVLRFGMIGSRFGPSSMGEVFAVNKAKIDKAFAGKQVLSAEVYADRVLLYIQDNKSGEVESLRFNSFVEMENYLKGTPWEIERRGKRTLLKLFLQEAMSESKSVTKLKAIIDAEYNALARKDKNISILSEVFSLRKSGKVRLSLGFGHYDDGAMDFDQHILTRKKVDLGHLASVSGPIGSAGLCRDLF